LREERDQAAGARRGPVRLPEVNRLSDDIKTAEQTVEALYERRVGKVVKMASLAAADMPTEEEGLTREERDLFDTLLNAIEENRDHVLDVLAGEASPGAVNTPAEAPQTGRGQNESAATDSASDTAADPTTDGESAGVGAADVMGSPDGDGPADVPPDVPPETPRNTSQRQETKRRPRASTEGQSDEEGGSETDVDRRTVRITDDVGAIFGVDEREYDLSTDDVVTLPAANADPLVERDAAEPLE